MVTASPFLATNHIQMGAGLVTLINNKIDEKLVVAVSVYPELYIDIYKKPHARVYHTTAVCDILSLKKLQRVFSSHRTRVS